MLQTLHTSLTKVTGIEIPRDAQLFSMDVESIYTNTDNNSGIEAVKQAFLRNPVFDRPDVDILELFKISLEHNDCYSHPTGTFQLLALQWENDLPPTMPTFSWPNGNNKH